MEAGERFDRYVIEKLLGRGGMGEVYVAFDESLRRRVALKILGGGGDEGAGAHGRLLDEARAAAAFEHPHVVKVFDVGESNGVPFMAMELVEGRALRAYVGDAAVSIGQRVDWLIAIGRALAAAHARGVVHRDVKPENVMVGVDGVLRVLDFGIARRVPVADREAVTRTAPVAPPVSAEAATSLAKMAVSGDDDAVRGTLAYMAPEQLRGKSADGAVDQWAWGVVAYELFAGERPWDTANGALVTVSQILSQEQVPLHGRAEGVTRSLSEVVQRALSKRAADRFPDMGAAVDALEVASLAERSLAPPPPVAPEARSRVPSAVLGVIAACASLALAFVLGRARSSDAAPAASPSASDAAVVAPPTAAFPDFGSPMSAVPAALAAYRRAMQATRDAANSDHVLPAFDGALAADPDFAAAYLRKAVAMEWIDGESREAFLNAQRRRDRLGAHDRAALDAMEPWYRVPHDTDELRARLRRLADRGDADFDLVRCTMFLRAGLPAEARDACRDAERSDPTVAAAFLGEGTSLVKLGDPRSAREAFEACLARSQEGARCVEALAMIASAAGGCDELVERARRLVVLSPKDSQARLLRAEGLLAQAFRGKEDYVSFGLALHDYADRSPRYAGDDLLCGEAAASVARGALEDAARAYEKLARTGTTSEEDMIAGAYFGELKVLMEIGRVGPAVAHARRWLAEREGWTPSAWEDSRIAPLVALYVLGALSRDRFLEERGAWVERERRRAASLDPYIQWSDAYGKAVVTADDARAALDALPSFAPLPAAGQSGDFDEGLSLAYLRAGRPAEAIAPLRGLTGACLRLFNPVPQVRGLAWLGDALAATGDTRGACAAWAELLRHWGGAASSVSATHARAARASAGCTD